jgi:hypothetical protein
MKVISINLGRAGILLNLDELLPLKGVYAPDMISAVTERYAFINSPSLSDSIAKLRDSGLKFQTGKLQLGSNDEKVIQDLTVYTDGILVTAMTTEDAELFFEDFFDWGTKALGLRLNRKLISNRAYASELVAEFYNPIEGAIKQFSHLVMLYNAALQNTYSYNFPPISLGSIILDYDRTLVPPIIQSLNPFSIERRANRKFTDNVFFCKAPLKTAEHIRTLEEIETYLQG